MDVQVNSADFGQTNNLWEHDGCNNIYNSYKALFSN